MSGEGDRDKDQHVARIAQLEESLRELLRLQKESEALAAEASDRVQRITEELRLLKGKVIWKREGRFEET